MKHLPRHITKYNGKEETLELSEKDLQHVYNTMRFDMELGNMLKDVLLKEKKNYNDIQF